MGNEGCCEELMRETAIVTYADNDTGVKNTAFDINIPEGHALRLYEVDFGMDLGSGKVANAWKMILVDDPDETADPGFAAEKVIQSTKIVSEFTTSGRESHEFWTTKNCHQTMLVQNPNFICDQDNDANAAVNMYARIWFDFVKVSPKKILELLRQQQY
jgi:hypothetical protein